MKAISRFLALSPADRSLLLHSVFILATIRLCLWVLPAYTVRRMLDRVPLETTELTPSERVTTRRITWAVTTASRGIPAVTCLTQALAAHVLLRRHGIPARTQIGVAKQHSHLVAHAWVESDGVVIVGGSHCREYTRLLRPDRNQP